MVLFFNLFQWLAPRFVLLNKGTFSSSEDIFLDTVKERKKEYKKKKDLLFFYCSSSS